MKILYAFNGTGYGHASRVMSILPLLKHYDVDILVSGEMNPIDIGHYIKYRFKGFTFVYNNGKLDYWRTFKQLNLIQFIKDIQSLNIKKYDLVISDFEPVSAYAAKLRGVKSLSLSHQASFLSKETPRLDKINKVAEWILKNYAPCKYNTGFHFKQYDDFILAPHIRNAIRDNKENTTKQDYILVYLSAYNPHDLVRVFGKYTEYQFIIISPKIKGTVRPTLNTTIIPADPIKFMDLLINCSGVITGGGFETVAEALYLNKQVLTIPIQGQYEQECNAEAASRIHNGYKGKLAPVYLRWFLERTKLPDADFNFKISTDEQVLQAIENVLYDKV